METTVPTEIIETVTEIIEMTDYTQVLDEINTAAHLIADASVWSAGFLFFFVVVVLCYFAYRFFRIFF